MLGIVTKFVSWIDCKFEDKVEEVEEENRKINETCNDTDSGNALELLELLEL